MSTRSSDSEAVSHGVMGSVATGATASAARACSTPRPIFSATSGSDGCSALVKSAWRTASTRRHGSASAWSAGRCAAIQSAAAAATCGVADDVPAPFMSTTCGAPISAHGMLGVKAASAVAILLGGPQQPCIFPVGRPKYGRQFAMIPQAAMTRPKRAGWTMKRVGTPNGPSAKLFPAAATTHTPAS
ncbi:hypothetical protein PSR1_02436 [Anaeromyxobacter sp. PSR-1]|nr:hypothetical protein PSR1_02436 [Anaeromyxobacter sp. PSR-1]